jgi:hypothetical protein
MAASLAAQKRSQAAIEEFAKSLPENQRGLFLASPGEYIKNATARTKLGPGDVLVQGATPIYTAPDKISYHDVGNAVLGVDGNGRPVSFFPKSVSPDKQAGIDWDRFAFNNLSAQQQGHFQREDRAFNGLSANQALIGNQRNTELGLQGLNTYYNTGLGLPGNGPASLPQRGATPPYAGAPSAQPVNLPQASPATNLPPMAPNAPVPLSPKAQQEIATAAGKQTAVAQAKNAMELPGAVAKADQAIKLIDDMIGDAGRTVAKGQAARAPHPGFQGVVGATVLPGARFIPGTDAADFDARLGQLKGQAFMQAYETLRGGGQITEVEGTKATAAITRMERSQSEKEFVTAAREFQDVMRAGVQRAKQKAGQANGGWSITPLP